MRRPTGRMEKQKPESMESTYFRVIAIFIFHLLLFGTNTKDKMSYSTQLESTRYFLIIMYALSFICYAYQMYWRF